MSTPTPGPKFAGAPRAVVEPPLAHAEEHGIIQRLTKDGEVIGEEPTIEPAMAQRIYETMVTTRLLDERGWELQRSGRVEFWIPMRGQEASHVASSAAFDLEDWIFIASREAGVMLWRGAPLQQLFAQIFGRAAEPLRGRRLPLLFGDRSRHIVPCTTQVGAYLPHAAGAAWAAKLKGDDDRAFIVYFGDGATSRGEFHSALNFAGVHRPPILFFCQNNGWAVSTPNSVQTATHTFAEKAAGYGLPGVRVDGNDFLALFETTSRLRTRSLTEGPTLVESVTYRQGFHTSSDNPDLYRTDEEAEAWAEWDPIHRARRFLERRGAWDAGQEAALIATRREEIRDAIHAAELLPKPDPDDQFYDVLATPDRAMLEQLAQLTDDLKGAAR